MTIPLVDSTRLVRASAPLGDTAAALKADGRLADSKVMQPHPLLIAVRRNEHVVLLTTAATWDHGRAVLHPFSADFGSARAALVFIGQPSRRGLDEAVIRGLCATVTVNADADEMFVAIHNAFQLIEARQRSESRGEWVNRYRYEIGEFVEIARAITKEREIDKLLALILEKSRFITSADAGSIYVVEGEDPDIARRNLHFKLAQNDSVNFDASEFTLPISAQSIAGYVALQNDALNIEDVYHLDSNAPYGFDRSFDQKLGYRTKSMLCAPLPSRRGEVIGVIQLINRKKDPSAKLIDPTIGHEHVVAFDARSENMLTTLASLAGVALENAILYAENERMLEGFVRASVEAIEQRDPTTSGHSIRVAEMTVGLAHAVERTENGTYADVRWSGDDIRELEYASLLHDFGKIGVREEVLRKAKKLYPHDLELLEQRFGLALRAAEVDILQRKLDAVQSGAGQSDLDALDEELEARRRQIEEARKVVGETNEPKVLSGGDYAMLEAVARHTYFDRNGELKPFLSAREVQSLSVPRGSLTATEIDEIRSHVVHTTEFLLTIPWGRKFRRLVQIAGAHHERLNGTGYPHRLKGSEIPIQSKIMSVSDIFDALTAADRPYKKAVPLEKAIDILHMEERHGHIDAELVRIFIDARVWQTLAQPPQ